MCSLTSVLRGVSNIHSRYSDLIGTFRLSSTIEILSSRYTLSYTGWLTAGQRHEKPKQQTHQSRKDLKRFSTDLDRRHNAHAVRNVLQRGFVTLNKVKLISQKENDLNISVNNFVLLYTISEKSIKERKKLLTNKELFPPPLMYRARRL